MLKTQAGQYGLEILAYCLMTNHVHLVVLPHKSDSLAKGIGRTHFMYTQYVNRLHGRSGHLWQGRFYSALLDDHHLLAAIRYLERNPIRAKIVRRADNYPWSSATAHLGREDTRGLIDLTRWREMSRGLDWERQLREPQDEQVVARLRMHTHTGRPLGSDQFISKLETLVGRRLRALPVGRPKIKKPMKKSLKNKHKNR